MSVYPLMRFYPGEYSCAHKRSLGKGTGDNFNHGMEGLKLEQNLKAAFQHRRMPSSELNRCIPCLLPPKIQPVFVGSVIIQFVFKKKQKNHQPNLSLPKALSNVSLYSKGKS